MSLLHIRIPIHLSTTNKYIQCWSLTYRNTNIRPYVGIAYRDVLLDECLYDIP